MSPPGIGSVNSTSSADDTGAVSGAPDTCNVLTRFGGRPALSVAAFSAFAMSRPSFAAISETIAKDSGIGAYPAVSLSSLAALAGLSTRVSLDSDFLGHW
jgi:hypothetical protein